MIEFQILDVDYVLVDEKPVIRIFGKTEDGKTVCGFYDKFSPYFYVEDKKAIEALKGDPNILQILDTDRKLIGSAEQVYKVITKNPAKTPDVRERLRSLGFTSYEADILFRYRFLNDVGLGGLCWIKAQEADVNTSTVRTERAVRLENLERVDKLADAPLRIVAFDIECVSELTPLPDAKRDPVIMISFAFSHPYKGQNDLVLSWRSGANLKALETEKEMLEEFVKIINEYDPDIITGYNVNNFDFPYILERMRQFGVKPTFSRCGTKQVYDKKVGINSRTSIAGRIVVDSFAIIKKDFSLTRYGLDFVGEKLLGEKKVDIKKSEIGKMWKGTKEQFDKLVYYSRIDSVLALNLVQKLKLMNKYSALSKEAGTLLQDSLDSGETTRIENFLLREFNKGGYIFPNKPVDGEVGAREAKSKVELKGGFVLEPEKGLHSNIVVLDFKSMYPSIIISFNMCPTTLVRDARNIDKEKVFETPAKAYFYKPEIRQGIIPKILVQLMERRDKAKKKYKNAANEMEKNILYAEQWALKILANSFYGYFGYARARMYDLAIANSVTSFGREIIHTTKDSIEKMGYKVVYGDTDSVMVEIREEDLEKAKKIATEVSARITDELPGIIELQFEKVFKRFLPLSKKRYVAWKFEPAGTGWEEKIEMKGVETVRRDWCPLVGETMKDVIDVVLKENDPKKALTYFKGVIEQVVQNKVDLNKLVITKSITRKLTSYAGVQPHVELAKKIEKRGQAAGIGDRIGYVIIKGNDILSKRTEDPVYVAENGLEIDPKYYIENQLLPPIERIFFALGITKSELMGGGKQVGLFDVFKKMAASSGQDGKKQLTELHASLFTGFICKSCSKKFDRPPLAGYCECGGHLLFNSDHGTAEQLVMS